MRHDSKGMSCQWSKIPRCLELKKKKGTGYYLYRLCCAVAVRSGVTSYYKFQNYVSAGQWAGGFVGLKKIFGVKHTDDVLPILNDLKEKGYIEFNYDRKTKLVVVSVKGVNRYGIKSTSFNWVYATQGKGFFCFPSDLIEQRIAAVASGGEPLDENEAILDMFCMTIYRDYHNAFSWYCPCISLNQHFLCNYQKLANRWSWTKSKVYRFFQKYSYMFAIATIEGCYGSVVFNMAYPVNGNRYILSSKETTKCFREIIGSVSLNTYDMKETFDEIEIAVYFDSKDFIKRHFCIYIPVAGKPSALYGFYMNTLCLAHEQGISAKDLLEYYFEAFQFSRCLKDDLLSIYEYAPDG